MRASESVLKLIQKLESEAAEIERVLLRNRTAWRRIAPSKNYAESLMSRQEQY